MKTRLLLASLVVVLGGLYFAPTKTEALSGSEFQAGRIIDDSIFFNGYGMDPNQIQNFLNSKVPTCDTWHARSSNPRDTGPPYTCLKNYWQQTWSIPADEYCNGFSAGAKNAAQIIHEVGVSCGINQAVILITLQKEQSFITDTWPRNIEYEKATGYGCPDTALPPNEDTNGNRCFDETEGFLNQVYYGARQFKRYAKDSHIFTQYRPYRNNYIQYNPNGGCGGTNIYIQNQATSGLYIYTPYQPNNAALNNLYGTGDGCSAYGNRNFWRLFRDWFGTTHSMLGSRLSKQSNYAQQPCSIPAYNTDRVGRLYQPDYKDYLLTTSRAEACAAIKLGYIWDGIVMQNLVSSSATKPVYRVSHGNYHYYTVDPTERQTLINSGSKNEGVAFYGLTAAASGTIPAYSLKSGPTSLMTSSGGEGTYFLNYSGFSSLGIAFHTPKMGGANLEVNRLSKGGSRLYTISAEERSSAIQSYGYVYEGTTLRADKSPSDYTLPVYRLRGANGYLQTNNRHERDIAVINHGFIAEGTAFYAPVSNLPGVNPVYRSRFYQDHSNRLFTSSIVERNNARTFYGFIDEGVGWYGYPL